MDVILSALEAYPLVWVSLGLLSFVLGWFLASTIKNRQNSRNVEELLKLVESTKSGYQEQISQFEKLMQDRFSSISLDLLSRSTDHLVNQAKNVLGFQRSQIDSDVNNKKEMIDARLKHLDADLNKITELMAKIEDSRAQSFGQLSSKISSTGEELGRLSRETQTLNKILHSPKGRGHWGEQIVDDILKIAGLVENINYSKQGRDSKGSSRPDFTFYLPNGLKINMDVKFPLTNYAKYVDADLKIQPKYRSDFLRDVRSHIKNLSSKDYINPEDNTVDCVIMLIPNEGIYSFILSTDPSMVNDAIQQKVIISSPVSLFGILTVIRQAVDQFALEQTSSEILELMAVFRKNWQDYVKLFQKLGKRIEDLEKDYNSLATTRTKKLESSLSRLDDLRIENIAFENESITQLTSEKFSSKGFTESERQDN